MESSSEPKSGGGWDDKEIFLRKAFDDDPVKGCELLFKQYYASLCSHAVRFVYSREVAEDIVGDVFFVFWRKKLHLTINTSFRAYLFTAVRNRALKYVQREFGKTEDVATVEHSDAASSSPEEIVLYHELSLRIERVIKSLPPQCQKVFLMSRYERMKNHEIAAELAVSVKAVEAHIAKALGILRSILP